MLILYFICSLLVHVPFSIAQIRCLDEIGNKVDWFIIYKLPRINYSSNHLLFSGVSYLYLDANRDSKFILSEKSINDTNSAVGRTLNQIINVNYSKIGYAKYNDEEPDKTEYPKDAHSKGTVGLDDTSGFWLVHNVPRYPPYSKSMIYSYPESGTRYGQNILCMSLNLNNIDIVGYQLRMNGPHFYDIKPIPSKIQSELPNLISAINRQFIVSTNFSIKAITTIGNNNFISFAKSKYFGMDLYSSLVASSLMRNLFSETWQRGNSKLYSCCAPSNACQKYSVYNVRTVKFGDTIDFSEYDDHSKWAVATDHSYICIGDINRMSTQFKRGGGTVCFKNNNVASIYNTSVADYYECQGLSH